MRKKIIVLLMLGLMIVNWIFFGIFARKEALFLTVEDQWIFAWVDDYGEFRRKVIVDRKEDFEGVPFHVVIHEYPLDEYENRTNTFWMTPDWVILKSEELEVYRDFQQRITKIYRPGIKLYDFPLSVEKEWSARSYITITVWSNNTIRGEETGTGSDYVDWSRKVVSTETVTVPAGTFDTYVVEEHISGAGTRFWFSLDAKNYVKMEHFGDHYVGGGEEVLTSYELAPQRNKYSNLYLPIVLATSIAVLGISFFLYNHRHKNQEPY